MHACYLVLGRRTSSLGTFLSRFRRKWSFSMSHANVMSQASSSLSRVFLNMLVLEGKLRQGS